MAVTKQAAKATLNPARVKVNSVAVAKQTPTQTTPSVAKMDLENLFL